MNCENCELLKAARRLAKQKGLDPKKVVCPADKGVLCTGTDCSLLFNEVEDGAPHDSLNRFYDRLQKHFLVRSN
jgi:hypothetical protein